MPRLACAWQGPAAEAGIIELDPVADGAGSVLDALEAMAVNALLFQRPDDALDHAVLLWAMRSDELLPEAVALGRGRVMAAGEGQAVVRAQQELAVDAAEGSEAADQGGAPVCWQRLSPYRRATGTSQEVHACGSRSRRPAKSTPLCRPRFEKVGGPVLIRCGGDGRWRLDARAHADGALANPPVLQLDQSHGPNATRPWKRSTWPHNEP